MTFKNASLIQELRHRAINKIVSIVDSRKKLLKVDVIYFENPIESITHFDKLPLKPGNIPVSFAIMRSHNIMKMLNELEKGNIYGWIEYGGSRCRTKPKKKSGQ